MHFFYKKVILSLAIKQIFTNYAVRNHNWKKKSLTFSKKQETSILQLNREDMKADSSHSIRGVGIGGIQQSS